MVANFNPHTDRIGNARPAITNRTFPFLNQVFVKNLKNIDASERVKNARVIGAKKSLFALDWIHRNKYSTVSILTRVLNNYDDAATFKQLKTMEKRGLISWVVHDSKTMPTLVKVTKKGFDIVHEERKLAFESGKAKGDPSYLNMQRPNNQRPSQQLAHALIIQEVIASEIEEYPNSGVITESEAFRLRPILRTAKIVKTPDAFVDYNNEGNAIRCIEVEKSGKGKVVRDIAFYNAELLLGRSAADFFAYYVTDEAQKERFDHYLAVKKVPRYDEEDNSPEMIYENGFNGKKIHLQRDLRFIAAEGVCDVLLISKVEHLAKYLTGYRPASSKKKGDSTARFLVKEQKLLKLIDEVKSSLKSLKKLANDDEYLLLKRSFMGMAVKNGSFKYEVFTNSSKSTQNLVMKVLKIRDLLQSEADEKLFMYESLIIYSLH